MGDFDRATMAHGLATTGGVISSTGVAGLTLGGGIGWLVGKHGMSIDNLRSVRLVTADGELITANHHSHPDLFWALRGGGGNFGVVTSFTFAVHPQGDVLVGLLAYPVSEARAVLEHYRSFIATAPDELGCYALLFTEPESMTRMVAVAATWPGDPAEGADHCPARRFRRTGVEADPADALHRLAGLLRCLLPARPPLLLEGEPAPRAFRRGAQRHG